MSGESKLTRKELERAFNLISAIDAIASLSGFCTVSKIITLKEKSKNFLLDEGIKASAYGDPDEVLAAAIWKYCRDKVKDSVVFQTEEEKKKQEKELFDLICSLSI